jgi:Flp pilus assembly protein TadG
MTSLRLSTRLSSMTRSASRRRRRRGSLTMELIFVLPILGVLLLGLFEYSLLFFARGEVVDASRAGARFASLPGCSPADVEQQVLNSLSPRLRPTAEVTVQTGVYSGDPVSVAVRVPMANAAPDMLWPIGFSLTGQFLYSETRMAKE